MPASFQEAVARVRAETPLPKIAQTRFGPTEYATYGDGPAVLAIHGGMGGFDQSLALARCAIGFDDHKVLAISRPGYLGTPLSDIRTPAQQADLCAALLDVLGVDNASIIAISAGGPSALQFALRHPDRCHSVVLVSACTGRLAIPPSLMRRLMLMKMLARVPHAVRLVQRHLLRHPEEIARGSLVNPQLMERALAHPEAGPLLTMLTAMTLERLRERLAGTVNDITQFQTIARYPLEEIVSPLLVIHGMSDSLVPFTHAEVAAQVPGAELMAIDGAEHVALFTHLDEIRPRVRAFLAEQRPCVAN